MEVVHVHHILHIHCQRQHFVSVFDITAGALNSTISNEQRLYTTLLNGYNPSVRPRKDSSEPIEVEVHMNVDAFFIVSNRITF